ncbi:SusD/RagB family nutrient-binding outer membrane lipoprotein [Sphingobacterium sp. WOUb80]|uniref:SusD/RagB family nutrient-binding outer membrane lipoprotein n=1 Tax=Sphingobacterium sp. WOUb80 TaxID=3234028 RepID=UPI003CEEDF89
MKNKILIGILFTALAFTGCKDSFFDINTNPNKPTDPLIKPSYLLPMVIEQTAARMGSQYSFAASWAGYYGRGSSFGPSLPLENYDITTNFEITHWASTSTSMNTWYDVLTDANFLEKKGRAQKEDFYVATAKVMKAIGFMYLVDMYNNVPYSDALRGDESIAPKYDKGADVYKDLLVQLDSARILLKSANLTLSDEAKKADVLFGGDLTNWRKLANTQALKLLIHQSEFKKDPKDEIAKIISDGAGFIDAGKTAKLSIVFSNDKYKVNPVYSKYVADESGAETDGFNRVSPYLLNRYKGNNDIRYQYFFLKALNPINANEPWAAGKVLGAPTVVGTNSAQESRVIGSGILKDGTGSLWLMTSVESLFLQAEAIQRGWITGDAKAAYENAVKESFTYLNVANATTEATNLLNASASWASASNKLELIINQKYLALPGINNFEAWVDYRRLGYPKDVPLSVNQTVGTRKIPLRLMYPQSEYNYNSTNVLAEGTIDPQKNAIFWDVN